MKYILIITQLILFLGVDAQVTLKGRLLDSTSGQALSYATISVYNAADTALITCRISSFNGEFKLHDIPAGMPCRMVVYDSGFAVYRKEFTPVDDVTVNLGTISLLPVPGTYELVGSVEQPPVIVHSHSIQFNPSAFRTLFNTPGGNLISKLPGILIGEDELITASGEKLKCIIIQGWSLLSALQ